MPNQTEPSVNNALGILLQGMMRTCEVRSEHTGLIADQPGAQIDNLITSAGRSPVAVEAEFMPDTAAEVDGVSRLHKTSKGFTKVYGDHNAEDWQWVREQTEIPSIIQFESCDERFT